MTWATDQRKVLERRTAAAGIVVLFSLLLTGCGSGSQTPLPELTRMPTTVLSPQEQQQAIRDLEAERARLDAEAAKTRSASH